MLHNCPDIFKIMHRSKYSDMQGRNDYIVYILSSVWISIFFQIFKNTTELGQHKTRHLHHSFSANLPWIQLVIQNSSWLFPNHPVFSLHLKKKIKIALQNMTYVPETLTF